MANAPRNRPALDRKTTRRTEKGRKEALDAGVAITVNGKRYTLTMGDVTGVEAKAFREQVGVPFMKVMNSEDDWDVDWIAGVVWLARRLGGERTLKFDQVAGEIGYDTEIDMSGGDDQDGAGDVVEGEVVEGKDPEGSGGTS